MDNLDGKTAVVTGAASGLGAALAAALDAEHMRLLLVDIDADGLARVAQTLGSTPLTLAGDVSQAATLAQAANLAWSHWDNVHLFINNAGVTPPMMPLWELGEADMARTLGVNVTAVHHGIRAFVPGMRAQGEASHIVITASEAAFEARALVSAYHASKHATLALAEGLAQELRFFADHVRVSVLCPGAIDTGLLQQHDVDREGSSGQRLAAVYRKSLERGMDPAVARSVVEGVKAERFYLLPHPEVRDLPGKRAQAVLDDLYPVFPPGLAGLITPDT